MYGLSYVVITYWRVGPLVVNEHLYMQNKSSLGPHK